MSIDAGVSYYLDAAAGQWVAPGRSSLVALLASEPLPTPATRDDLVPLYGKYVPGLDSDPIGATAVGLSGALTSVQGDGIATINIPATTAGFTGVDFRSRLNVQGTTANAPLVLRNCRVWGPNPQRVQELALTNAASGIVNFGGRLVQLIDCVVDNGLWMDAGLANRYSTQWSPAFHGSNFELERTRVRRFTDLVNFAGVPGGVTSKIRIIACRLHENWFGPSGQAGGVSHSDIVQWGNGNDVEIMWSYLGGDFTQPANPGEPGIITPGANNAVFMIQQEVGGRGSPNWFIENFYIHDNWLHGGAVTANLNNYVSQDVRYNTMAGTATSGCRIVRNKFAVRGGTNKGTAQIRKTASVQTYLGIGTADTNVLWVPGGDINGNGTPLNTTNGTIVTVPDQSTDLILA